MKKRLKPASGFFRDRTEVYLQSIVVEVIPHNIGCVLPRQEFLVTLRQLTQAHGSLLIFDEVITGFRHGLGGYQRICGVTPDLSTFAKAMANGYPIAAVVGRAEFMDRFGPGGGVFFAGTYNGHPVGVAAALATIAELEDGSVHEHCFALARQAMLARDNLRVVVMSATIDAAPVAAFLGGCPIVEAPGRMFPLDVSYRPGVAVEEAVLDELPHNQRAVSVSCPGHRRFAARRNGWRPRSAGAMCPCSRSTAHSTPTRRTPR